MDVELNAIGQKPTSVRTPRSGSIPISCNGCAVAKHTAYADLHRASPGQITSLRREQKIVPARQTLFREGEVPPYTCRLYFGWAFGYTMLPDGRRQILSFYVPGDCLPLHGRPEAPLSFSVRALTDVGLCVFDREAIKAAMLETRSGQLGMLGAISDGYSQLERRLVDIGRRSALGRMAKFFVDLEARLSQRGHNTKAGFDFPLRQEHLADALGLTSVHVNRTLARLRKEGVINIADHRLEILDTRRLHELVADA